MIQCVKDSDRSVGVLMECSGSPDLERQGTLLRASGIEVRDPKKKEEQAS